MGLRSLLPRNSLLRKSTVFSTKKTEDEDEPYVDDVGVQKHLSQLSLKTVPAHDFYAENKFDTEIVDFLDTVLLSFYGRGDAGPWIGGGLLRRALQGETLENLQGDIDIFSRNIEQAIEVCMFLNSHPMFSPAVDTPAKTTPFSTTQEYFYKGREKPILVKIQVITLEFARNISELLARFDTYCSMIGTDGISVTYEDTCSILDAKAKVLRYNWDNMQKSHTRIRDKGLSAYIIIKRYGRFMKEGYIQDNPNLTVLNLTNLMYNKTLVTEISDVDGYTGAWFRG